MIRASTVCQWCEQPFRLRRGGSPQRFCGAGCRTAFWTALRRWGERAVAAGILTIDDIRNGHAEACTLLPAAGLPRTAGKTHGHRSSLIGLRADSPYSRQCDFERLLARTIAARRR
jgi:hypothetical protein